MISYYQQKLALTVASVRACLEGLAAHTIMRGLNDHVPQIKDIQVRSKWNEIGKPWILELTPGNIEASTTAHSNTSPEAQNSPKALQNMVFGHKNPQSLRVPQSSTPQESTPLQVALLAKDSTSPQLILALELLGAQTAAKPSLMASAPGKKLIFKRFPMAPSRGPCRLQGF